mgnify:CR=1 FL=1
MVVFDGVAGTVVVVAVLADARPESPRVVDVPAVLDGITSVVVVVVESVVVVVSTGVLVNASGGTIDQP